MKTTCKTCGVSISRKPSQIKPNGNYCSKGCFYASGASRLNRKTGQMIKCRVCESMFYVVNARINSAIYCSRKCKGIGSRLPNNVCAVCGIEFKPIMGRGDQPCCSKECGHKYRQNGKTVTCAQCGGEIYKSKGFLKTLNFCDNNCHNAHQGQNKVKHTCKMCGDEFALPRATVKQRKYGVKYCSLICRSKDPEWVYAACIMSNVLQQNRKGLNKLELAGREILNNIGVEFQEQVLMFDKFLVDVLIEKHKLIIQWDGVYWHSKPRRAALDKSQDAYMKKCGYIILRVTDHQIKNNKNEVYEIIKRAVQ